MRSIFAGVVLYGVALLSACGGGAGGGQNTNPMPVLRSMLVTGGGGNLTSGQSQQMKAVGTYSDNSTQDLTASAQWSSSTPNICTVASGGLVTAGNNGGACAVTASFASIKGSASLTVVPALVSIVVTPGNPSIAVGTTEQFIATGTYSDNSTQNLTGSATWSSSNPAAATVSTTAPTAGLAKAVAGGSTTITATSGAITGTILLTVTSASPVSIAISPTNISLPLGLTQQFTALATFDDGTNQDVTGTATWKSSASSMASITTSGLAVARNVGTTNISATFGAVSDSTPLTVNAANLNSISIEPANGSIAQGTRIQLSAIGTFNDGGTRDVTHQATWSVSDPSVLNIGASSGFAIGLAPGLVTVTATLGSATQSVPFTVTTAKIVSISLSPSLATIPIGGHARFTATGVFDDSSTQDISMSCAWSSTNTAVATVGSSSGTFGTATALSSGTATINAAFSYAGASATGSAQLTVSGATLAKITVSPSSGLVTPGSSLQFAATGTFSDGSKQTLTSGVTWTSSDTNVATVSAAGAATGQSPGVVTITAKAGGISGTSSLVVESSALTSIQVTPVNVSIPATVQTQFKAIGQFADGNTQDLTGAVTWTSSSSSIATISNASGSIGLATGIQPGTVTISAVFNGQVGTATLTVNSATLNSISITPGSASINVGAGQAFTAKGAFSNGSVINITNQVQWNSSSPSVATIDANGSASGVATGTATISASMNGVNGTAILTVQ